MSGILVISVHFLDGRYHGAGTWPPDPARLFQALVAGIACGTEIPPDAKSVLMWLERLDAPTISAPPAFRARPVTRWVPNNDVDAKLETASGGYSEAVVRTSKVEHPWIFEASQPLLYLWEFESLPPNDVMRIVENLSRLGHGTDSAFASAKILTSEESLKLLDSHPGLLYHPRPGSESAIPCEGTLGSLVRRHAAFGQRFSAEQGLLSFRQPPKPHVASVSYTPSTRQLLYHIRSTNPEAHGGFHSVPLVRAATLAELIMNQASQRLAQALPEQPALCERLILGKGSIRPDASMRIRVIPLPSSGHPEVDPSIRRILVDIPPTCPILIDDLDWAFSALNAHDSHTGELYDWCLERVPSEVDTVLKHLQRESRIWRTLTPMLFPQIARRRTGSERQRCIESASHAVLQALRHAGLKQKPTSIRIQREPFLRRGSRADYFQAPAYLSGDASFIKRLAHVELQFRDCVSGPLVIGDGRFRGLGLMEPSYDLPDVWLFAVLDSLSISAIALARATRRAVMSRVASELKNKDLPDFFTGHQADGSPLRHGVRAHIGFLVDPDARHLLIATPHALNKYQPNQKEIYHTRILGQALSGLQRVVAGAEGVYHLLPLSDENSDLLRPSKIWESATDWQPCRHGKGDPALWIADDIFRDCSNRKLVFPTDITVLRIVQGRNGGLRARLRLTFSQQLRGPLSFGRTAMCGGGTFKASS